MKVTKKEAQGIKSISQSNAIGKKFKNISSSKTKPSEEIDQNEEASSTTTNTQKKGTEQAKTKHLNEVNVIPLGCQQESFNLSTETPVLLSSDGILRQVHTSLGLFQNNNILFFKVLCVIFRKYFTFIIISNLSDDKSTASSKTISPLKVVMDKNSKLLLFLFSDLSFSYPLNSVSLLCY